MILLALIAHIFLMIVFTAGIGISWAYKSIFGLLFFGSGLVMSVSSIFLDDLPELIRKLKGLKSK